MSEILEPQMSLMEMNQRQDADKIPDSASPLLVNVSLDKPGVWAKRKGSSILGTTQSGVGVQGGIDYYSYAGTHSLRIIRDGNLDIYNGSTFATSISSAFTTGVKVQSVLLNNRAYHISPSDYLQYETGTGVATTVGAGGNEIRGQNLAVAQNTLFVGNITYVGTTGIVSYQDRVYYSFYNSTLNLPSDQLYTNTTGQNTLATSTRFFTLLAPNTCLFSYGVTGLVYAFTETACYQFDLRNASNSTGVQRIFNIGCCGPRAITECNGWMVWMDVSARIWAWGGAGPPIPLSWAIEDDVNGEAVINLINKANLSNVSAGTFLNKFYFDVGNVTVFNEALTNVQIKGLVTQGLDNVLYSLDTYPYRSAIFIPMRLSNQPVLLFGATGVNDVYQMNVSQYNDNNVAINMIAKSKFFYINDKAFKTNSQKSLFIKYRPQTTTTTYLRAKYAVDLNTSYTTFSDPASAVTSGGVINMYASNASTKRDAVGVLKLPQQARGRTISYEVGNGVINQGCEISGIGLMADQSDLDVIVKTS